MEFLPIFVIILAVVCLLGFVNEKLTKLPHEIALMLFSVLAGIALTITAALIKNVSMQDILEKAHFLNIEKFLMDGVLCFMLFSGSCHMKLTQLKKNARGVTVLALLCTLLGAGIYGLLFFGVSQVAGLGMSLPLCLMFGSIIAPTDPIAATGILNKFGLPKDISFLIEGESLFNDGVGVALFVCFSGMATAGSTGGFVSVMLTQIIGAVVTGALITLLCFPVYKFTNSRVLGIFASLLSVSLAYFICEKLGFSGAIASVVCGITFSTLRSRFCPDEDKEKEQRFDSFWETIDSLLNSVLYVMLGLTFVHIMQMPFVLILSFAAIIANLIARSGSLAASSLVIGHIPDGYDRISFIKLLTWGGLRGGLSVALAMSVQGMFSADICNVILGCTYAVVFFTTVIQGLTIKPLYNSIEKKLSGRVTSC